MAVNEIAAITVPVLTFLGGVIALIFNQKVVEKKVDAIASDTKELKQNDMAQFDYMQTIYRRRLEVDINNYLEKGFVSDTDYRDTMHLYQKYKALKGNGYIDEKMEQLTKLWRKNK